MADSGTESLIERIAARDRAAFTEFTRKYEHVMLRTAHRILGQVADALEVRQNVLTRVWRRPLTLPRQSSGLEAWVRRSVINESISLLRTNNRRLRRESNSAKSESMEPDDGLRETADLQAALRHLDAEQRALLSLRFDDELTIRQIAETLEKPHTTIQSQLQRAIAQLRSILSVPMNNNTENRR